MAQLLTFSFLRASGTCMIAPHRWGGYYSFFDRGFL
jgi:hypothetical protein